MKGLEFMSGICTTGLASAACAAHEYQPEDDHLVQQVLVRTL